MNDWSGGYVTDIGYTYGYYVELNPLRVPLIVLNAGLTPPPLGTHGELGFGQGVSINLHAAASDAVWYGTDFNPSQAAFAQTLARASGAQAHLVDEAFADFCTRSDLPDFDFIGLHGIWSWISDANRAVIVDFVRRKLKVGGVLYISYNTLPGWSAFAPMRHLMVHHTDILGTQAEGIVRRIDEAIAFAEKLLAANPLYARANPQVVERVKKIKEQNRHYLAHEYFNRDWHPMHFATMAEWLQPAKVHFACSAHALDHIDAVHLSAEQQNLLAQIPDRLFRETVRDFMVNQQFRRDYWVKGVQRLSPLEQAEALRQHRVVLTTPRSDVPLKVSGTLGEANLVENVYHPVLDALADHKPKTLGWIEQAVGGQGVRFAQVQQAVMVLLGAGHVQPAQEESVTARARKATDRLNAHIMGKARASNDLMYLASPVTGGGVPVSRFEQLFLLAAKKGRKQPAEWAEWAWEVLAAQGQRVVKEGRVLERPEDNLAELQAQARAFAEKRLPVLKALQIA
uniref:Methyltransferase n=1 Tax=Desulfacinum infernum TaxID=35837 RepID=A0A832A7L1_9BACT